MLRQFVDHRELKKRSKSSEISLDRLRRRVLVERVLARIVAAEPGQWGLNGAMALEVRSMTEFA